MSKFHAIILTLWLLFEEISTGVSLNDFSVFHVAAILKNVFRLTFSFSSQFIDISDTSPIFYLKNYTE